MQGSAMELSNVVFTLSLTTVALFATMVFVLDGKRAQFKKEMEVNSPLRGGNSPLKGKFTGEG